MSSRLGLWQGPVLNLSLISNTTFTTEVFELHSAVYYVRSLTSVYVTKEVDFWREEITLKYEYLTIHCIGLSNGFGRKLNLCLFPLYLFSVRLIVQCFYNCQDLERLYSLVFWILFLFHLYLHHWRQSWLRTGCRSQSAGRASHAFDVSCSHAQDVCWAY